MPDKHNTDATGSKVVLSAINYIENNDWPVFPCNPLDKRPLTKHGFKDATKDIKIVKTWWKQWPNAMIGVPMGRETGCFCVDLDRKEGGHDGITTWKNLEIVNGAALVTRMHTTPSTGQHLLFQWMEGIRNIPLNKLAPGIEIKGDGGYIILPPSKMADGRSYVGTEDEITIAPVWLLKMLNDYNNNDMDAQLDQDAGKGTRPEDAWTRDPPTIEEVWDALDQISSDPYEEWFKVGAAIRNIFGERGWGMFERWSRRSKKFSQKDCMYKWKKLAEVRNIGFGSIYHMAKQANPNWEWKKKQEDQKQDTPPKEKRLLEIDFTDWDDAPVPVQEWAVDNRIPLSRVCLFSGEGAAGKSLLQLQLSVAHVLQKEWLGVVPRRGEVIFIDAEDDVSVIHRRLHDILKFYNARFSDLDGRLHIISLCDKDALLAAYNPRTGFIVPTDLYKELTIMVQDIKPVMIGIASSADVFNGNEIDRSQVRYFIAMLTRLAMIAHGAVNLISHPSLTGINTETGLSGNTAWHNSVRARMYLKSLMQESTNRELVFKKNNYGPISDSIMVSWQDGLFLPVYGAGANIPSKKEIAKTVFLELLKIYNDQLRYVNDKGGRASAPNAFVEEEKAQKYGLSKKDLANAMHDLLLQGIIKIEEYDKASRPKYRLIIVEQSKVKEQPKDNQEPYIPF